MAPCIEQVLDAFPNQPQLREVFVVQALPPGDFPDPLDGVELGAVRRQVIQRKPVLRLLSPAFVESGVMECGVVCNDNYPPTRVTTGPTQLLCEGPERFPVESVCFSAVAEFPVAQANRAEIADSLPGRRMQKNRIFHFGRNPHTTPRAVLLKVDFVQGPEIHRGVLRQR